MSFVLGVDLDGVTGDYVAQFRHYVARFLGISEEALPAPTSWDFGEQWGMSSREEFLDLHARAVAAGMFRAMAPMPGAVETLWKLSGEDIHIRVITHRLIIKGQHRTAASDTVDWLESNNVPYRDLCFQGDKVAVSADCYIDDSPGNVEALRAAGGYCIVFDAPYNQHIDGPRAHDWDEAYALIVARRDDLADRRIAAARDTGAHVADSGVADEGAAVSALAS